MKAVAEAEAYPGPSLIIAYSPCINHGIKAGMGKAQEEQRKAVAAGYWDLYRYNPQLKEEGKIHSPWIPKNQLKTSKTSLKVKFVTHPWLKQLQMLQKNCSLKLNKTLKIVA